MDTDSPREEAEFAALAAAREYGIGTILFRNTLAKRLGLNLTESLCLTILGIRGSSTPGELSRFTGLTSGAVSTMLDRLEARRFVKRRPNPRDRRGVIVEVDEEYSGMADHLVAGIRKANLDVVSGFTEAQLHTVRDFLTHMAAALETESARLEHDRDFEA